MILPKLLRLPNPTTIIVSLIVLTSFSMITSLGESLSILLGILLFFLTLREMLEYITRFIESNSLRITDSFANIQKEIDEIRTLLGIDATISLLVSNSSEISIETFGRIKNVYIAMNEGIAKELESNEAIRKPVLFHELSHIYFGDHWKVIFARQTTKIFLIFSLLFVSFGGFSTFGFRQFLIGSQLMAASHLLTLIVYPLLNVAMLLLVREILSSRELFADFLTSQYLGKAALFQARMTMAKIGIATSSKKRSMIAGLLPWNWKIFSWINRRDRLEITEARVRQKYLWINLWGGIVLGSFIWSLGEKRIILLQILLLLAGTVLSAYSNLFSILDDDRSIIFLRRTVYSISLFFLGALIMPVIDFLARYSYIFWGLPVPVIVESSRTTVYTILNISFICLLLLPGALMAVLTSHRIGKKYLESKLNHGDSFFAVGFLSALTWLYTSFFSLAGLLAFNLLVIPGYSTVITFSLLVLLLVLSLIVVSHKNRYIGKS